MMRYIIKWITGLCFATLIFSACNSWLEVEPTDQINDKKLFGDYNGFRNALNGIYQSMAAQSLYGRELSWGMLSGMSQTYVDRYLMYTPYQAIQNYNYEDSYMKKYISNVWQDGYNVIANCNKLLDEISQKDSTFFPLGAVEKQLIEGEAYAARAYMHFDLLRLFAPSVQADDRETYIPYFKTYPSKFEPKLTVDSVLKLVVHDLKMAQHLVARHDTIYNVNQMGSVTLRLEGTGSAKGGRFFGFRGIRLNYVSVCGLLARVYLYAGNYEMALQYAGHVYHNFGPVGKNWFSFTHEMNMTAADMENRYVKMYDDILFAVYDKELLRRVTDFKASNQMNFQIKDVNEMFDHGNDADDWRKELILSEDNAENHYSLKWYNTNSSQSSIVAQYKIAPMIRLSEVYYIYSESLWRMNRKTEALQVLNEVRNSRGAKRSVVADREDEYINELVWEGKKEFLAEGQMFYMFKRLNSGIVTGTTSIYMGKKYILPTPDIENIH